MVPLDHGPNRFAQLAVVHRGFESVAATRFPEVRDQLEVHLEGLRAHRFLGKGAVRTDEAEATQLYAVPPGPRANPRAGQRSGRWRGEVPSFRHQLCRLRARALGTQAPSPPARGPPGPFAVRKVVPRWPQLAHPGR
jgi:hypothetical protein